MSRIVVLQLARLGDIIQSLPAIQGLKTAHPNNEITLVVRSTFADAARLSPHVDKIVEFPSVEILTPALSGGEKGKAESLQRLGDWVRRELGGEYDLLLNFTFSNSSSYLASLIRANERRGPFRAKDGTLCIHDSWSQYFFAQVLEKNLNLIHLNELFMRIAGVDQIPWPPELAEATNLPAIPSKPETVRRIGIQLTASQPEKALSIAAWTGVCAKLLEQQTPTELVFFGSEKDVPIINQVLSGVELTQGAPLPADKIKIIAGTLRFHENASWVRSCDWIVAPDTAIVHLASVTGTRVIEIALGNVNPRETGPYGPGHSVVRPLTDDASKLGEAITQIMDGQPAGNAVAHAETRIAHIRTGSVRHELAPVNFKIDEATNFFEWSYYLILAQFRCAGIEEEVDIPHLGIAGSNAAVDRLLQAFDSMCALRRLAEFGSHYCMELLEVLNGSKDKSRMKELLEKTSRVESMIDELKKSVFLIKPLIDTWVVAKDLASGPDGPRKDPRSATELVALTEGAYRELKQNADILEQLLQTAVQKAHERAGRVVEAGKEVSPAVTQGVTQAVTKERQ